MTREELQSAIQDFWDEAFNHSVHPEISAESKMIAFQCMIDEAKRRSTQPLTLEELRRMDGEPIWGESLISGKPGEWSILKGIRRGGIDVAQYQKKPVTVEAVRFDYSTECISALLALGLDPVRISYAGTAPTLRIGTLEGTMTAQLGDYIIRGVNGEFYPCKPDIFEKTYEEV